MKQRSANELMDMIKQIYSHILPRTTDYTTTKFDAERADKVPTYECKAVHKKLDIVNYVADYEQAKKIS